MEALPVPVPNDPPPAAPARLLDRAALRVGMLAGFWVLMWVLDASQSYFYSAIYDHEPISGFEALWHSSPTWLLWAALTPFVFRLARRVGADRPFVRQALPVHLLAGLGVALVHILLITALYTWLGWATFWHVTFSQLLSKYLMSKIHLHLLTYWAIVGAYYALEYYRRFREREVLTAQLRSSLAEARLQALRTQLQPHFLFNTLNAVSVLAMKGETAGTVRMLSRLSDLLRLSLDTSGEQQVPLRDELDCLALYLDIEQVRFADRLTVAVDVEPQALAALVPNLLLQPLVENSVRHGLSRQVGAGRIEVRAARDGGMLRISVRDTGPGFAPGQVKEGIGVANTRARLREMYGDAQRFTLENARGGGGLVTVEIPFRPAPSEAAGTVADERVAEPAEVA
jgi:two-component system LytT family sensor kinase